MKVVTTAERAKETDAIFSESWLAGSFVCILFIVCGLMDFVTGGDEISLDNFG